MAADQYVPTQYVPQPTPDLRNATVGPRGYKMRNKRKLDQLEEQVEQELNGMQDTSSGLVEDPVETQRKRFKHDLTGNGKVSGRPWKLPGERTRTMNKAAKSTAWDKKMEQKASRKAFVTRKREATEAFKAQCAAKAKQRKDAKERKKVNQAKSAVVQTITNPATLKKMMKSRKTRKRLVTVDAP